MRRGPQSVLSCGISVPNGMFRKRSKHRFIILVYPCLSFHVQFCCREIVIECLDKLTLDPGYPSSKKLRGLSNILAPWNDLRFPTHGTVFRYASIFHLSIFIEYTMATQKSV